MSVAAVIVAAGSGTRYGDQDKVFAQLGGAPVLQHSVELFLGMPEFEEIVVVLAEHSLTRGRELLGAYFDARVRVCLGGETRSDSVRAGLDDLRRPATLVAVHDAARPLATPALVLRVLAAASEDGAAVPSLPLSDTVQEVGLDGRLVELLDRDRLRAVQTPQIARREWLLEALSGAAATDEGSLLHLAGYPVRHVEGARDNIKLTWPADLALAEALLAARVVAS